MAIKSECVQSTNVSKIKLEDAGQKVIFRNLSRESYNKIRADGCLLLNALCADWVLSKPGVGDVVVEFKGSDVRHALKQIEATLELLRQANYSNGRCAGLVICSKVPRIDSVIQRAKLSFAKKFRGALKISSSYAEFEFEQILEM